MGKNIAVAEAGVVPAADGRAEQVGSALVRAGDAGPGGCLGDDRGGLARRDQRGMVSAEWAVGIVAAIAIAGVLLAVITSGPVEKALLEFVLWVIKQFAGVVS